MQSFASARHIRPSLKSSRILEAAKAERQFVKAIEAVKHGLPEVLFIDGQNPLALLHDALSEGLHAQSDEECLELATDIRMVLGAFAERMGEALREQRDLTESVTRLMRKRQEREKALKAANATQVEGAESPA